MLDEKKENLDTSSSSSDEKKPNKSDAEGGDKNVDLAERLTALERENESIKKALKKEREKKQTKSLSSEVADEEDDSEDTYRAHRLKELAEDRISWEESCKKDIIKRFPSIEKDNEFGLDSEVVENYNNLVQGAIKRGRVPKTKDDVASLVEKAVKMTYPDIFLEELKSKSKQKSDYEGIEKGDEKDNKKEEKPKTEQEKEFAAFVDQKLKK